MDFWKKKIKNSANLDSVVNGQAVTLAYNTTKLEVADVTFHDTREIFEHGRVYIHLQMEMAEPDG